MDFLSQILSQEEFKKLVSEIKTPEDFQRYANEILSTTTSCFRLFDKNYLIDFDMLLERTAIEYSELNLNSKNLQQFIDWGYFPKLYNKEGKPGYMISAPSRIDFILKISSKWGYNNQEIRYIAEAEDELIESFLTIDGFEYSDLPPLPFLLRHLEENIKENKIALKYQKEKDEIKSMEARIVNAKRNLAFLKGKKFEDLSSENQHIVNEAAYQIQLYFEELRVMFHGEFRAKILLGFSPDIHFDALSSSSRDHESQKEKQFIYSIEHIHRNYEFGSWKYKPQWIDPEISFFATPEFYIGYDQIRNIIIKIRDPKKVDAQFMRTIDKYYSKFRSNLGIPRKKWGEQSGRRKRLDRRNRLLRKRYRELRELKPYTAAEKTLDTTVESVCKELGTNPLSPERAKRIIYSKKRN